MSLYRGEYDLNFISYNSETAPDPSAGEIEVRNGYDFMYNEIKGLVVQPQMTEIIKWRFNDRTVCPSRFKSRSVGKSERITCLK